MKNSTLVYKSAIIILGIAWPFILPAHRFPSFYYKSCVWWHWNLSISNSENCRAKFKGKKTKWKNKLRFFWISQKRRHTVSMLHRNWLKIENYFPPYFKPGCKDFLKGNSFSPMAIPFSSSSKKHSRLTSLVTKQDSYPSSSDVCNSNCSIPVLPCCNYCQGSQTRHSFLSVLRQQSNETSELTSEPGAGSPWQANPDAAGEQVHTNHTCKPHWRAGANTFVYAQAFSFCQDLVLERFNLLLIDYCVE